MGVGELLAFAQKGKGERFAARTWPGSGMAGRGLVRLGQAWIGKADGEPLAHRLPS